MDAISKGVDSLRLPASVGALQEFDEQFQIFEEDGQSAMIGVPYKVTSESGKVWLGRTDSQGRTERVKTLKAEKLSLVFGRELEQRSEAGE
ncbi:hypothetical protein D3C79_973070 [compost metagenome]